MLRRTKRPSKSPYARPAQHPALRSLPTRTSTPAIIAQTQPRSTTQPQVENQIEDTPLAQPLRQPPSLITEATVSTQPPAASETPYTTGENPLISITDELGVHVPQAIKDKIWAKQYVDLSKLLDSESENGHDAHKFSIIEGQLVAEPKVKHIKIATIDNWIDAFLIFASIYLARHPSDIQAILKYIHTIRMAHGRQTNCNWLEYDRQFRLKISKNPTISFGSIDAELWLMYMQSQVSYSSNHSKTAFKCFDYNFKGSCLKPHCTFQHVCMHCNKSHPRTHCWSFNSPQSKSTTPTPPRPNTAQNYPPQSNDFRNYKPKHSFQPQRTRFNQPRFNSN
ncbi:uncharacterized protein LOC125648926 [Ostrea edulis]|uniref:uncharacterized protein LOC125648926 n=1 Tax=Ostrea edulis TaxID=37623 RepID=UPI0020942143|nr:uncharacterized protein LOC125648926 [Ostrea edulis]